VYDFTGREVKTLVDCFQAKGKHSVKFDASKYWPECIFISFT